MGINQLKKLMGKRNFTLYYHYLLKNKVPEPFQSFNLLHQLASQKSLLHQSNKFNRLVTKRKLIQKYLTIRSHHYPIQYILGTWQFMTLQLKVKPPVLIPRFQTEQMIAILLENQQFLEKVKTKNKKNEPFRFLQLGCGSGAIGLSLSHYFQQKNINYSSQMVDIQPRALSLSKLNMSRNKINSQAVNIYEADMISLLNQSPKSYFESFDLIISNPPYISENEYNATLQRQVKRYESKLALIGDEGMNKDGLFYVESIINNVKKKCTTSKPMVVLQYGGQTLSHLGQKIQQSVVIDYYGKRRFIFLINW